MALAKSACHSALVGKVRLSFAPTEKSELAAAGAESDCQKRGVNITRCEDEGGKESISRRSAFGWPHRRLIMSLRGGQRRRAVGCTHLDERRRHCAPVGVASAALR